MNRYITSTALVGAAVPALMLGAPLTSFAATNQPLSQPQKIALDKVEISVLKNEAAYAKDQLKLSKEETSLYKAKDNYLDDQSTISWSRDGDHDYGSGTGLSDSQQVAYEEASSQVHADQTQLNNDLHNLETNANTYRGMLYDYGQQVPQELSFVTVGSNVT